MKTIKYLVLSVVLVMSVKVNAQTNLDSLYTVWQDETRPDSARTKAYKDYIWKGVLFSNPDTAGILADELIQFATEKNDLKLQYQGFTIKGISNGIMGDYAEALDYFTQCLKIAEQMGHKKGMAGPLGNIGNIYSSQGNYPKALDYFTRCLKVQEQTGDQIGVAQMLNNIGLIYEHQGDHANAMDHYTQCLNIYEQLGESGQSANALHNIGNIHITQGNYSEALDYHTRSAKIREEMGDQGGMALSIVAIGRIYQKQSDHLKALDYFTESLMIFEQLGDQQRMATSLRSIGGIYATQGDHLKALDFCQRSYDLALSIGVLAQQKGACNCLYDTYKTMGNDEQALLYLEKMQVINDSLQTTDTAKKLQRMEFDKELLADSLRQEEEKHTMELTHQEEVAEKDKTRNMLMGGGLLLLLAAIGLFSRNRYVNRSKKQIQKEKDRSEELLLNILPEEVAEELKEKGEAEAQLIDHVTVLFTDFKGFTALSEKLSPKELVNDLNLCFSEFDKITSKYGIEKIKTIGDAYMAAGGLPTPNDTHARDVIKAAMEMRDFVDAGKAQKIEQGLPYFEIRIGVHTGPVVAGIVGVKKFQYDIWGDTVNTASRMESSGEVGQVNISEATYELVKDNAEFIFTSRGKVVAKGKGEMEMYFVSCVGSS